ncbi:hypothetical protein B7Y92_02540 [Candidatus Saccharibacteria bacterium 32-50-13]|nr:MAG: hypothetical protein B7Y92_02540 [Candidatus Saccharibacteria bacterium 32-50-13]
MPSENVKKKSTRIATFDLLRGYFMLSIIINHLQWYPNGLDWVAFRGTLLVSAAEGFFLISGIVLGIVRGAKLRTKPFREAAILLIKRGVLLYIVSVILAFLFTLIGWWFFMDTPGLKPGIRPIDQPLNEVIMGILSFRYIYGWADFLRLYSIFILISPLALWLLRKNLWYVLMAISIGIWSLFPWALEVNNVSNTTSELLMVLSWQLIFFGGMTIGYHWDALTKWWQSLTGRIRRSILIPVLAVAAVTLVVDVGISVMQALGIAPAPVTEWYNSLRPFFNKEELPIYRLILFGLWFILGFYIFSRYERIIKKLFGWLLLPFGHNSLYVYILHAVILFFAHMIILPGQGSNILINAIGTFVILGIIYIAVRKEFLFKIIPR